MNPVVVAAFAAQGFPIVAGLAARRRLTAARRWVLAWGVYSVVGAVAQYVTAQAGSNLWTFYLAVPVDASLALAALSCFQEHPLLRSAFRWAIAVALVIHLVALLVLENRTGFSIAGVPSYAVIAFGAALVTLIVRALDEREPLLRQDWFWISAGWALYFCALALLTPLGALLRGDRHTLLEVYYLFQAVNVVAYAAVAAGLLCPRPGAALAA